jgi:hypothetical protein
MLGINLKQNICSRFSDMVEIQQELPITYAFQTLKNDGCYVTLPF